jgi:hypothetical protein
MLNNCALIQLPKINDPRGNLTFIQPQQHLSFPIKRVYYLYDVPAAVERGGHAHLALHQLIVAVSGSFEVKLYDGFNSHSYILNKPFEGLYICPMIWRELYNFSASSVSLVLASEPYDESDYIRDINDFNQLSRQISQ